ncbi:MAG TPA: methyltransferase domain-containing protein [Thermoanaerobaculia bacterium]|jgi:SAM-dependent methyltransferase|nr:methyltransferase domain-containing protein [Thermoanaerobaculia bacterium]
MSGFRARLKGWLGPRWTVRLRCLTRGKPLPRWGNLRRTRPLSETFGFDRGTPVDRFYLDRFFERHRADITGEVLEIQAPSYARRYGQGVTTAHSVDIEPRFAPTYCCDLAEAGSLIPAERYDCFLLPNTLTHLRDLEECLRQALRVVRPGGAILASTAVFSPLIPDGPDYWRISAAGWWEVTARVWPGCEVKVESHGNCLAALAAMLGLAHEELTPAELQVEDPRYPVLVTIHCRKPGPRT